MPIIKCSKGHFYDNAKYSLCPHCGIGMEDEDQKTVRGPGLINWGEDQKTVALRPEISAVGSAGIDLDEDDKTIHVYEEKKGADRIVGWLVCIEGKEKGRDFRLHQGFNRMGRDYGMDIPVMEDKSLGREPVCAIVYEDRTNKFFAVQQQGNLAYLNGVVLEGAVELKTGDIIQAGNSRFEFIAFCREGRSWEDE